jgi:hypothetical protein
MSDQSLATLLAWLREESRMLGWDMIIAVERDKANLLLRHDYMARFDRGEYLEPISGSEEIVGNYWRGVLHDFIFDAPRLMFRTVAAPTPEDPGRTLEEALLTMDLMSGVLVSMENENVVWRTSKIQAFDTLQANKLYLHLDMPQTLAVQADGAIKLDFRFAQNFEMALTGDADFNDQVSIAFRTLFHDLDDARRRYPLVVIPEGVDASLRPETVMLYPQASPNASLEPDTLSYGSGALLALAKRDYTNPGAVPGPGYQYLIPDSPDKIYTMTVLVERSHILRTLDLDGKMLEFVMKRFGWSGPAANYFRVESNPDTGAWIAYFLAGVVSTPGTYETCGPFYSHHLGRPVPIRIDYEAANFQMADAVIRRYNRLGRYQIYHSQVSATHTALDLHYGGWDLKARVEANARLVYETYSETCVKADDLRMEYASDQNYAEYTRPNLPPHDVVQYPNLQRDYDERRAYVNGTNLPGHHLHETSIVQHAEALLGISGSLHPAVHDAMTQRFDAALNILDIFSPLDTVCFGTVNPNRTSLEITPHELIIGPGQPYTFTSTAPDSAVWAASNIDPTSSAPPGGFGPGSTYWAPPLTSIKGNHTRVRVSATQGRATAHALITVAQPLSINPLVATCDADLSGGTQGGNDHIVKLFAALIQEEGARITWTIKNAIEGESGSLQPSEDGHTCTFTAHPFLETKKCVLDEVEVKVEIDEGGQIVTRTRQALVLASHVGFTLNIHIAEASLWPDTLKLIARLADTGGNQVDAKWRLADQSPGYIGSEDGIYVPDPERPEKFALIFAAFGEKIRREGYLILPLPYLDFPEELILLSQPQDLTETTVTPNG